MSEHMSGDGTTLGEQCPRCGHMPHDSLGFCPNMASDNECDCPSPAQPAAPSEYVAAILAETSEANPQTEPGGGLPERQNPIPDATKSGGMLTPSPAQPAAPSEQGRGGEGDVRCPNCGALLIGSTHQTACLVNATRELERFRAAMRYLREVCDQVDANPIGWGGASVVSLVRTLRNRVLPLADPTTRGAS